MKTVKSALKMYHGPLQMNNGNFSLIFFFTKNLDVETNNLAATPLKKHNKIFSLKCLPFKLKKSQESLSILPKCKFSFMFSLPTLKQLKVL